jgi:hypothetical protein
LTAAERHPDGIAKREVFGIDGLATVGDRSGVAPAGHPFTVVCHSTSVFMVAKIVIIIGLAKKS